MRNPSTESEQEDQEFKTNLNYKRSLKTALDPIYPIYKGNVTYTLRVELVRKNRVTITS